MSLPSCFKGSFKEHLFPCICGLQETQTSHLSAISISQKERKLKFLDFQVFFCSSLHALTLCFPCKLWYTNIASLQNYKPPAGSTWLWELFSFFFFWELFSYFFSPTFIFISWKLITLHYWSGFCHTLTWISHGFPCVPHPYPPSSLPLHPIPLGLPNAPALEHLSHASNLDWWSVSPLIIYVFWCCSLRSSHPHLLP